jgi:LacI family transcriptional regulator
MTRTTIYDIAKRLNINPSTVHRALNGKPGVSEEMRHIIKECASRMNYKVNRAASSLSRNPVKIGFIYINSVPAYFNQILNGVEKAHQNLSDFNLDFECAICASKQEYAGKLKALKDKGCSGIITVPSDVDAEIKDIYRELAAGGIRLGTITDYISDETIDFRIHIHTGSLGRIAAELLGTLLGRSKVAFFTSRLASLYCNDTLNGFLEEAKKRKMKVAGIFEDYDDPETAGRYTERLIDEHPDVKGIFISTANSSPVCKVIRQRKLGREYKIVAMDVFPELIRNVEQGIINVSIFQDPYNQGYMAYQQMFRLLQNEEQEEKNILVKPQIVLESNIREYL